MVSRNDAHRVVLQQGSSVILNSDTPHTNVYHPRRRSNNGCVGGGARHVQRGNRTVDRDGREVKK